MLENNYMAQIRSLQKRINPKPSAEEIEKRKQVFMLIREINASIDCVCCFDYRGWKNISICISKPVYWDPEEKKFFLESLDIDFPEDKNTMMIFDVKDIENFVCCF